MLLFEVNIVLAFGASRAVNLQIETVKKMMLRFLFLSLSCLLFAGCTEKIIHSDEPKNMKVWVSIQPLKFFIDQVSGGGVDVTVMVPPKANPESFKTNTNILERVSRADLYFGIGMPYERTLLPEMELRMNWVGVVDMKALAEYDPNHVHTDMCLHSVDDAYVWLNPQHMARCAIIVYQGLSSDEPRRTLAFRDQAYLLIERLEALDAELKEQMAPYKGRTFYINHPTLGHFAHHYGLEQVSIEATEDEVSAESMADLIRRAKSEGATAVLTQPQFPESGAEALAQELGLELIEIDVMAEDYFENMRRIADSLEQSFTP